MKALLSWMTVFAFLFCLSCDRHDEKEHKEHDEKEHKHDEKEHDEKEHKHSESEKHSEHDGAEQPKKVSLAELSEKKCEHDILQVECNACRSELGVVKLGSDIEPKLIKSIKVAASLPTDNFEVIGEVRVNQLKTVAVFPIVSGRVMKVHKRLGEQVKEGELLAILHSQDYGKAKLEYISAHQRYAIAQKNMHWVSSAHENLKTLLDTLQHGEKDLDLSKISGSLRMGKYKEKLIESMASYRLTKIKYARENRVLENMRSLLEILKKTDGLKEAEHGIKALQIGEWKGRLLSAGSRLYLADKNYEREKSLSQRGASTQKEVNEAETSYQSAKADYQGLLEEASLWIQQKSMELQAEFDSISARYQSVLEEMELDLQIHKLEVEKEHMEAFSQKDTTEKQLYLLGLTSQDIEKLVNQEDRHLFASLEIRAPISGTIILSNLSAGQFVEAQRELYTISDLSTLWVWCDLYEDDLTRLRPCQNDLSKLLATLHLPGNTNDGVPGNVDYLADVMEEKTRTVKMRVVVENNTKNLRPGMFVRVRIQLPANGKKITVPESAIFSEEKQSFLFKKWKDNFWVRSDVVLGQRINKELEIVSGVEEGDLVVNEGGFLLKSEIFKSKMGKG